MSRDIEILDDPRPVPRYTSPEDEKLGLENPGYRLCARRPRVRGLDEMREPEQAERIEGFMRPMSTADMGSY